MAADVIQVQMLKTKKAVLFSYAILRGKVHLGAACQMKGPKFSKHNLQLTLPFSFWWVVPNCIGKGIQEEKVEEQESALSFSLIVFPPEHQNTNNSFFFMSDTRREKFF